MPEIKNALRDKRYKECIALIDRIDKPDDELAYVLAISHFELGASATRFGSLLTAKLHLQKSREYCAKTIYDTTRYESTMPLYMAIINNINAPLLELEVGTYDAIARISFDYELYRYVMGDCDFDYSNLHFKMHLDAKARIRERRYGEAIELMKAIEANKNLYTYNVYMILALYTDMDNCYKQLRDFENAHKYSTKKITLLENLNT